MMSDKNFTIRVVLTFATMLMLAMFLQSVVVMILGVRTSIRQDVAWGRQILESHEEPAIFEGVNRENGMFSCLYYENLTAGNLKRPQCSYPDKLRALTKLASEHKKIYIDFVGAGWNTFLFFNEVALFAVPQINKDGQVIGCTMAERSFLPIYSRYKEDVKVVLCYLLVNVLLFSGLSYFRMSRLFFQPLNRLVDKAETYRPNEQLFLMSGSESPLRKLSASLNTLLERIEKDNCTLRNNLRELEGTNKELIEKNELVVRAEKLATAGRLSAGLAHEIGNPLSIIQGYLELLSKEDINSGEKKQFSERAQQELDRIQGLIKQLLEFTRPVHSQGETVFINALINDVIGFVKLEKRFVKCLLRTKLLAEDDTIVVDKDALRQVLINCLFNAADATATSKDNDKEIDIVISHEKNKVLESLLVISVQDNGTGISGEQLDKLFDPFFTTKEVGRGTGLGLFVCHTIMERLGGSITLGNRALTGVEVRIVLPLKKLA